MTSLGAIEDNQYLVVFFITCLLFIIRLAFNYLMFRSREVLNNADDNFANAREDQIFEKNDDISSLMATLTKTRQKLRESQEREKKAIEEKNATIKKLIAMQHQLDEAQADIDILHKENRG
jgi:septal ring factor EnvC (AmiA/AmiB activator)